MPSPLKRWWRVTVTRRDVGAFLAGGAATLFLSGLAAILFVLSGLFDVSASKPHTRLVYWLTHTTMVHSVRRHAGAAAPPAPFDRAGILAGFCAYQAHCVTCHGAIAVGRRRWVNGMTPDPPYLVDAPHQWTPAQLHWIIGHGVKMTGMPAWSSSLSDREIWNLVAFLETAPNRDPDTAAAMRAANACAPADTPLP